MGCIYSAVCCGMCVGCSSYQPEKYCGHAEDLAAQQMGYDSDEDYWADQEFDYELEQKAQAMEEIFQEQINKIDGNNKDNCGIDS